ncbi:hypothetical protein AA23498_2807 [Acetobacter nitrogenifigens DSM 23921 = NBRC 105050]|nr:hypothetical protein AA23498_2807 [Acetobacter nitrogenifigens DSM 23921 = NBRC 105050]
MNNGKIEPDFLFRTATLATPDKDRARQAAGAIHVHPNGRYLYVANRAEQTEEIEGQKVFKGGENSIAVFAIDQSSGKPVPIQHVDSQGIHPRTFHIDPSGRMLVAEHNAPETVRDGGSFKIVQAGLSVFKILDDGRLEFVRKYDIDVGNNTMFWCGMSNLPSA